MKPFFKKYLAGVGLFLLVIIIASFLNQTSYINIGKQSAAVFDPGSLPADADPASGFAWNDNVGWINFGTTTNAQGRVYVSNNELYGYAWGENIGWISMNCENDGQCGSSEYAVTQTDSDGTLTGFAWGENIGWIDFSPDGGGVTVTRNTSITNTFSGYAWGENIGWISFSSDSPEYGVTTTWTPPTCTSFNYSDWSSCLNGNKSHTIISSLPIGCTNGDPILTDSCGGSYNPPTITTCTYEYSDWGICVGGVQTRTVTPATSTCSNTSEALSQSCSATTTTIGISITPSATTTIFVGEKIQFTATVTGTTTNTGVTWLILPIDEENFYGTITDTGLYTAPTNIGNLTFLGLKVIAKAKADISKIATAEVVVNIIPPTTPIGISLSPSTSTILVNKTIQFVVNVTGTTTNNGVDWLIIPIETIIDDFYGTISNTGLYTAPDHAVNITIQAKAKADATKSDRATVIVKLTPEEIATSTPIIYEDVLNDQTPPVPGEDNSNSGGNHNNVSENLDVSGYVSKNIAVLGTTTQKIYLEAKKILESPVGSAVANTITTVGVVGGGVAVSSALVLDSSAIADLLFLPFRLWGLLLSALGLKKRNRPWGTVYDSITKQPIDPAYVTLKQIDSQGETTSITDLDGRYGFLVSPGKYVITANKTNYTFPSKKLSGTTADALYNNLYFGEQLEVTSSTLINKNIPLDPIKFDWNEFTKGKKKLMRFYSQREKITRIATDWIFRIGFVVSLISLFLVSAPYNLIIFGLYLVLAALRKFGLRQKALGSLTEKNGNPLSFAIIRVYYSDLKTEVTNKVADKIGRYYCLVPKGSYYIKVEKKNDDESYSEVFTSPVFEAKNGIIDRSFVI